MLLLGLLQELSVFLLSRIPEELPAVQEIPDPMIAWFTFP